MLDKLGFNLWADDYDKTVEISEDNNQYPFAGYKSILNQIFNETMQITNSTILDIGIGTGILASKLYEKNHDIYGIDFASRMLQISKEKMPNAKMLEFDINQGLPKELKKVKFHSIISTYTLHHITDRKKIEFIKELLSMLHDNGKLYIGDISFRTFEDLEKCKANNIKYWDNDEYYFVYEYIHNLLSGHCHIEYEQISHCGGIYILSAK